MKKNLYYRIVLQRRNLFKEFLYSMFLSLASYPRMVIEVFIRSKFGERYFSLSSAWGLAITLFLVNVLYAASMSKLGGSFWGGLDYFLLAGIGYFMVIAYRRNREIDHDPSSFNFMKFTKYQGDRHSIFNDLKTLGNWEINPRRIETILEPAPFFLAGLILVLIPFTRVMGIVLLVSSIMYAMSYVAAYAQARTFLLDKIDEMICNEDLHGAFVDEDESKRGIRWIGPKPQNQEDREKIYPHFFEDIAEDEGERAA